MTMAGIFHFTHLWVYLNIMAEMQDKWNAGDPYEYFMGRWSILMAPAFLKWLNIPPQMSWLDVGCGTGALSVAIEKHGAPLKLSCIDPSAEFINTVRKKISPFGTALVGSVEELPFQTESFDSVVSGLALNFFPNTERALSEMKRVSKQNGVVAAYVWDYSDRMEFLRYFWDAACQIDPEAGAYDEGRRFPICRTENLARQFNKAGLTDIETSFIDIETVFTDFDDYWKPFWGGQGPAPGFLLSLSKQSQNALKEKILERIKFEPDGSIKLAARALVVRGFNKPVFNSA